MEIEIRNPEPKGLQWFSYHQNNSGGDFIVDEDDLIAPYVIIQATDGEDANRRALMHGLYFDGIEKGRDCECCGDRWYAVWRDDEGMGEPTAYTHEPLEETVDGYWFAKPGDLVAVVVHVSGQVDLYRKGGRQLGIEG